MSAHMLWKRAQTEAEGFEKEKHDELESSTGKFAETAGQIRECEELSNQVNDHVTSLGLLTERFCNRMIELAGDINISVAVSAIDELVYDHLIAQNVKDSTTGSKREDVQTSKLHLGRMLQILREFPDDPILSAYVIDDVWDDMKAMKDCKCMNSMLLDESPAIKVTVQDLEDTYQPPFKNCVEEGHASRFMCSYSQVHGVPTCADYNLLTKIAKGSWGFYGYITSDCDAVSFIYTKQNYTKTPEDAVAITLKAGMGVNCGDYVQKYAYSAIK